MKRYYMVPDEAMPDLTADFGTYHFIDLASHGPAGARWNLLCLADGHIEPDARWTPLPPLYDARTRLIDTAVNEALLTDVGLTGQETAAEAVMALAGINPLLAY